MIKIKNTILNINILCITENELLRRLDHNLIKEKSGILFTPNVDHLCKLQHDEDFYRCYQQAEWVVCDSKILWRCSKFLKNPLPEAIPGSSFFTHFYEYHKDDENCKIFLLGSPKQEIAERAMNNINAKIGRNIVVGAHSPSFGFEKKDDENLNIVRIINKSGANVVLVGVGAPKQEKWIMRWREQMPGVKIWMALGATIEFEAGTLDRAPLWMQRISMEWLYRAFKDPKRLLKRYFIDDMQFFYYFAKQLLGLYHNPWEK